MHFAQPHILYSLWLIPILWLGMSAVISRRQRLLNRFAEDALLKEVAAKFDSSRMKKKWLLLILIFTLSFLALARPQWGFEWQEVKLEGSDILIAIDTSKSMLTQDVKPHRLARTKLAVKDLLRKLKGDRVGLIAFAGEAFLVCPLTVDYSGFLLSLNDLNVNTVPRGGTNIGKAIEEALKNYEDIASKFKALIIMTDGDNVEGDPGVWAKKAKEKNIKIYTIGIGTKEGELIRVPNDKGEWEFFKDDNGNFVKSRLNENLLQDIALTTGGIYVKASGSQFGLDVIYEQHLSQLEKREIEAKMQKKYYERFQIPLALALLFLVLETCLTTRRKNV